MADPTPSFERFLTALRRREPDRVPIAENWVAPEVKSSFLGRPINTLADDVAFWKAAGYDFFILDSDLWATRKVQDRIITPVANTANVYDRPEAARNWVTPEAAVVKTWEDIERFDWPKAEDIDYSQYRQVRDCLPPGMGVIATFGHIFTTAWQLMGFEAFCLNLLDDVKIVQEVMGRLGQETISLLERVLAYDSVNALWFQDDIAYTNGLMISPQGLRELFFPWLAQIAALCHARGLPLIFHSDGKLDEVLPDIVAAGVDALHPIEPKCMNIVTVKQEYGDRLALIGNLDLGYTLTRGSPDEVREEVRYLIKNVAPGGGYMLGSANSITDYVPIENYRAMLKAAFEFGRYPIDL